MTHADATHAPTRFQAKFEAAAARNRSLLCVGLDPDPAQTPAGVDPGEFLAAIVEATADLVCCFKPNIAFYEPDLGAGLDRLRGLIGRIPDGIPVLLDAKRGDIGHTATFYARAAYESLGVDAMTVNPYLGRDAVEPHLAYADRTAFLLARTSNAGARDLQDLSVLPASGGPPRPLYEHVAGLAAEWNRERGNVGVVVGATYPEEARRIRALCPGLPMLMPGVGAQAGDVEAAVRAAIDERGGG
ncbi:MAG: orotidine-5'-phosphate decarboxylase, partial [Chloroflexi bacterium]|nr:orotidine-5'-phosphate decarboxylase [Chloroflexota bacterium]